MPGPSTGCSRAGILQVFHRISTPDALVWTEKTRAMFGGMYFDYSFGDLGDRCFAVPPIARRDASSVAGRRSPTSG